MLLTLCFPFPFYSTPTQLHMDSNQIKTIVVAGASGLIGSALMELLIKDVSVKRLIVLTRRPLNFEHPKVKSILVDFKKLQTISESVKNADILYCCIGTTIKSAGSKEAFRAVDYEIPLHLAELAAKAGISKFIAISSLGADPESKNFYLKTKGEMERDIDSKFQFRKLAFVRPSMLLGPRKEFRLGERIGQFFMVIFSFLMVGRFSRFKPIHDFTVAKSMISISNSLNNQKIYDSSELQWLGR